MKDNTLDKSTKVKLEVRDMAYLSGVVFSFAMIYFSLKTEIAEAKELPPPQITLEQFNYSTNNINNQMKMVREDIKEIKESVKKMEERIYEIK